MSGFSKIIHRVVAFAATTMLVENDHKLFTDARMLGKLGSNVARRVSSLSRRIDGGGFSVDGLTEALHIAAQSPSLLNVLQSLIKHITNINLDSALVTATKTNNVDAIDILVEEKFHQEIFRVFSEMRGFCFHIDPTKLKF